MSTDKRVKNKLAYGAWRVVILLFFVGCLNYLDRTMITTMRTSILQDLPMTNAQFGLLSSVFLWVYGICSPLAGFLADNFKRSKVIIISLLVWSVVTLLSAYVTTYNELLITRILLGISEACYIPAAMALIIDYHSGETRSFASGIHVAGILTGQSFGFLGGWIAEHYHWNASFAIFGIVGIVYAFILILFLKDVPITEVINKKVIKINFYAAVKSLFRQPSFLLLLCLWSLLYIVGWLVIGWMPTYYQEHFSLSQSKAGLYATAYLYPVVIIGVIAGGLLTDFLGRKYKLTEIWMPLIGLCIAAPSIFIAAHTNSLPLVIGMFMLYGFTRIFSDANIMPILCLTADSRYRATGYGILNFFASIIGGFGIYAGGILRDEHVDLSVIFQFASFLLLFCVVILFLIKRSVTKFQMQ